MRQEEQELKIEMVLVSQLLTYHRLPVLVQVSRMGELRDLTMCRVLWRILNLWWGGGKGWGDVVDTVVVEGK